MQDESDRRGPSNSQILDAIKNLHGDVKVALDRTESHAKNFDEVFERLREHDQDISAAKGGARLSNWIVAGLAMLGIVWEALKHR